MDSLSVNSRRSLETAVSRIFSRSSYFIQQPGRMELLTALVLLGAAGTLADAGVVGDLAGGGNGDVLGGLVSKVGDVGNVGDVVGKCVGVLASLSLRVSTI